MDKEQALSAIFADDPLGILVIRAASAPRTSDERLVSSFQEITDFYTANGREPEANQSDIAEYQLHARLNSLREDTDKAESLEEYDQFDLLKVEEKEINSIDDIFDDDSLNILGGDDEGLFDFEHTPKQKDINKADFVAQRKRCKDFDKYEQQFKDIHHDLKAGKRKLIPYQEKQLNEAGNYFVHNGILLYLETINDLAKDRFHKADGRTKIIFENGTESNMKLRSLGKNLLKNSKAVTANTEQYDEDFLKTFNNVTDEDDETGFIYVLKSNSMDETIASIANLHKIGYSKNDVAGRIKNAEHEPTYLMASVSIVGIWQCFNMNPQKFEQLLHNFFGMTCLDLDVFDDNGKRHRPQEWFIVPIEAINQAIEMIISGVIVNYRYDQESESIVLR
ncbi:conserved hypothetical protein [Isorropodon fossajaponicum endosymbiont JTNG4]|uniref:GIY-YIG nuclease family protein n=1 Tax=Isorropodon fossajaponicum symbiont TaxID=883811 RepID=UPI001914EE39|nr:GIY-YIG nuclease family protein [Isorropodon fossajaponicum symbiont]BBB24092.1 conserved hypothetical protein [Isorropodon fossajaponicum endosymbiont JTNG4]